MLLKMGLRSCANSTQEKGKRPRRGAPLALVAEKKKENGLQVRRESSAEDVDPEVRRETTAEDVDPEESGELAPALWLWTGVVLLSRSLESRVFARETSREAVVALRLVSAAAAEGLAALPDVRRVEVAESAPQLLSLGGEACSDVRGGLSLKGAPSAKKVGPRGVRARELAGRRPRELHERHLPRLDPRRPLRRGPHAGKRTLFARRGRLGSLRK